MTIKEVSEQCGISADTLRYYERIGAIPPVARTAAGQRDYSKDDIGWVKLAICMRSAGCSMDVLIKYIQLYRRGDSTAAERLQLLKDQREELFEQRKKLDNTIEVLSHKIAFYENAAKNLNETE
ncbi:MAG: MerR family transcriptional regulator [Clostridia bacterium]|nr:MerR family transcriptional regulator [Clostridia bacterium]